MVPYAIMAPPAKAFVSEHIDTLLARKIGFVKGRDGEPACQVASGSSTKHCTWRCLNENCSHEFLAVPSIICKLKSGCPFCAGQKLCTEDKQCALCIPKSILACTDELTARKIQFVRGPKNETAAEMFPQTNKMVTWRCLDPKCGHEFTSSGGHVFGAQKSGCPYCCPVPQRMCSMDKECAFCIARSMKAYEDKLYQRGILFICGPDNRPAEETAAHTNKKCTWQCLRDCGRIFEAVGNSVVGQGTGCFLCVHPNQTLVTKYLIDVFGDNNVKSEVSFEWIGRRRFDIMVTIPDKSFKVLVEVDGEHHFITKRFGHTNLEKQLDIDCTKMLAALKNNYSVVRIPTKGIQESEEWKSELLASIKAAATIFSVPQPSVVYCQELAPNIYAKHRAHLTKLAKEQAAANKRQKLE